MNIPSYVVAFPATTARKTFFGTPTRSYTTQPVQIRELAIYVLEQNKNKKQTNKKTHNKIIYFHLKITKFYSREKLKYSPYVSSIFKI